MGLGACTKRAANADQTLGESFENNNLKSFYRKSYNVTYHKRCLSAEWFCGLTAHETKAYLFTNKLVGVSTNT